MGGVTGEDPFTLEPWSDGYRLFQTVSGTAQLISTAMGISSVISFCLSPCRSLHWGSCFVGETQVLTREIEAATTSAVVAAEDSSPDTFEFLTPVCILLGAAGAMLLQRKRQSRGNSKRSAAVLDRCDELFADPHDKSFWDSLDPGSIRTADSDDITAIAPESRETVTAVANNFRGISSVNSIKESAIMEIKPRSDLHSSGLSTKPPHFQPWRDSPPLVETPENSDRWRPTSVAWLLVWLLLGGFCFLQARPTSWATPTIAQESTAHQSPIRKFESKAIQDIQTGMRVVANNPELNGQDAHQSEIDPATWRNVRLRMEKPDGGELLVTLLRSGEWLKAQKAETGSTIQLTFAELGIDGPADVLAVEACPTIETGNGRVVTGTFRHSAANVIDLHVSSEDRPIGTTANHPFWSETRQEFVQASSLLPCEELRATRGDLTFVTRVIPRSGQSPVYNLEVDTEHVFSVGKLGVLVHNTADYNAPSTIGAKTWQEYESGVQKLYGETSFKSREYTTFLDGQAVNGVADNITTIGGKNVAVEAKFVNDGWANSLRNPASPIGNAPFAVAEQATMLEQARKYSAAFDETIYHSNSPELIAYYTKVFEDAGITNFRFILTK